jgi:hypothetical protein
MTIEQTVEIPADYRPVVSADSDETLRQIEELKHNELPRPQTIEEAIKQAEVIAADPDRQPLSRLFGSHKGIFGGDGTAYQRKIRDEWD